MEATAEKETILGGAKEDATFGSVLDAASAAMPEPTIDPSELEPFTPNAITEGDGAAAAEVFDPNVHESKDGQPVRKLDGSFKRKRGRGAPRYGSSTGGGGLAQGGGGVTDLTDAEPHVIKAQRSAENTVNFIVTAGITFGGDDFVPVLDKKAGRDERAEMVGAFARYYEAYGSVEAPAWLAPLLAVAMYAAPRLRQPQHYSKLKLLSLWAWSKTPWGRGYAA